jgi:hypothetical protein
MKPTTSIVLLFIILLGFAAPGGSISTIQNRISEDVKAGRPLVAHVVVALCDNEHQGIVPVPAALGNGDQPATNLYWGALYGLRTHLTRKEGWKLIAEWKDPEEGILERIILTKRIPRRSVSTRIFLIADAWQGSEIRGAVTRFLEMAAGKSTGSVDVSVEGKDMRLKSGGSAHVIGYVGHNGLMDFSLPNSKQSDLAPESVRSAFVLACASKPFFLSRLKTLKAHPLLLTTGLMAPEAYSLAALLDSWFSGVAQEKIHDSVARAYHRYQKCGVKAARRLFWVGSS